MSMPKVMSTSCEPKAEFCMVKAVLLDTDVVIHLLRKREDCLQRLLELKRQGCMIYVCPVVVAEIYAGAFVKEHPQIERFFSLCSMVGIDEQIGKLAGSYAWQFRKSHHTISLEDYLIAACAKHFQLSLWTCNKKHYPMADIQLLEDSHV